MARGANGKRKKWRRRSSKGKARDLEFNFNKLFLQAPSPLPLLPSSLPKRSPLPGTSDTPLCLYYTVQPAATTVHILQRKRRSFFAGASLSLPPHSLSCRFPPLPHSPFLASSPSLHTHLQGGIQGITSAKRMFYCRRTDPLHRRRSYFSGFTNKKPSTA